MFLWCLVSTRLIFANPVKVERTAFEHIEPTEICLEAWWYHSHRLTQGHRMNVCEFKSTRCSTSPRSNRHLWGRVYWTTKDPLISLQYQCLSFGWKSFCLQMWCCLGVSPHPDPYIQQWGRGGFFWLIPILFLPTNCIGVIKYADPISFLNAVMWYACVKHRGKNGITQKMRSTNSKGKLWLLLIFGCTVAGPWLNISCMRWLLTQCGPLMIAACSYFLKHNGLRALIIFGLEQLIYF